MQRRYGHRPLTFASVTGDRTGSRVFRATTPEPTIFKTGWLPHRKVRRQRVVAQKNMKP
ncbi:MAG: hypothetical protein AAF722_02870 [Cyanobacteria bacterium P01_C01_bin.70]